MALRAGEAPLPFSFTDIAEAAGLHAVTVYGGRETNRYLLETTGTGVAAFDFDNDGFVDLFFVNGSTLEGFPPGREPRSHLYRNRRDGTFEDVTARAGLSLAGWGQGACAGDYDNDGWEDLFVTFWGTSRLFRNRGDGSFGEATGQRDRNRPHALGLGVCVPRLRPRRTARTVRRQLHRSRPGDRPRSRTPDRRRDRCRARTRRPPGRLQPSAATRARP